MTEFIILSLFGGILLAIILGLLGNFILWNRMSYLGDCISHTSLLGLVIAIFIPVSSNIIVLIICFISSFLLIFLNRKFNIAKDSLLILNTQISLALGFIILNFFQPATVINNYFFGNILGIEYSDILALVIILFAVIVYLYFYWQKLILLAINEEIYIAENGNPFALILIFMFILSAAIVYAIKFAGILLVPSLIVIPALIANHLFYSPIKTVLASIFIGSFATIVGISLSTQIDIATGPLITVILVAILFIKLTTLQLIKKL